MDRGQIYARGGGAWMNTNHAVNTPNFGLGIPIPNQIVSKDSTTWGWLSGMGAEYRLPIRPPREPTQTGTRSSEPGQQGHPS